MSFNIEKYTINGNGFVGLVAEDLEITLNQAVRIIRSVLHALRNRLSHEESFQLIAQLPMALKGLYVDGWKFNSDFIRIRHIKDFLDEVRKEDGGLAGYDFGDDSKAKHAVSSVIKAMNFFVSEGEMNDIMAVMPDQLKAFIKESIAGKETVL